MKTGMCTYYLWIIYTTISPLWFRHINMIIFHSLNSWSFLRPLHSIWHHFTRHVRHSYILNFSQHIEGWLTGKGREYLSGSNSKFSSWFLFCFCFFYCERFNHQHQNTKHYFLGLPFFRYRYIISNLSCVYVQDCVGMTVTCVLVLYPHQISKRNHQCTQIYGNDWSLRQEFCIKNRFVDLVLFSCECDVFLHQGLWFLT